MDGWGLGKVKANDAIQHAATPFVSSLYEQYPNTTLITCGEAVGLPEGQMGNSEVGHLNLGAGRIVYQELQRINVAIRDGAFQQNKTLQAALDFARTQKKALHLRGEKHGGFLAPACMQSIFLFSIPFLSLLPTLIYSNFMLFCLISYLLLF